VKYLVALLTNPLKLLLHYRRSSYLVYLAEAKFVRAEAKESLELEQTLPVKFHIQNSRKDQPFYGQYVLAEF
jgi:hypothetical protein